MRNWSSLLYPHYKYNDYDISTNQANSSSEHCAAHSGCSWLEVVIIVCVHKGILRSSQFIVANKMNNLPHFLQLTILCIIYYLKFKMRRNFV